MIAFTRPSKKNASLREMSVCCILPRSKQRDDVKWSVEEFGCTSPQFFFSYKPWFQSFNTLNYWINIYLCLSFLSWNAIARWNLFERITNLWLIAFLAMDFVWDLLMADGGLLGAWKGLLISSLTSWRIIFYFVLFIFSVLLLSLNEFVDYTT